MSSLLSPPADPQAGDDILAWAIEVAAFLRAINPQSGPDVWPQVTTTGTHYLLKRRRAAGETAAAAPSYPFQVKRGVAPEEEEDKVGWVKVHLHSMLMRDVDPTSKITITGLDESFQMKEPWHRIWLEINLTGLYEDPATSITATIGHGADWNGDGKDFFPTPVEYNTDDGTFSGSTGTPPSNTHQTKCFVPIAYTVPTDADPFLLAGTGGIGFQTAPNVTLIQQLSTHLIIGRTCFGGDPSAYYALPFHAPFPTQPE